MRESEMKPVAQATLNALRVYDRKKLEKIRRETTGSTKALNEALQKQAGSMYSEAKERYREQKGNPYGEAAGHIVNGIESSIRGIDISDL